MSDVLKQLKIDLETATVSSALYQLIKGLIQVAEAQDKRIEELEDRVRSMTSSENSKTWKAVAFFALWTTVSWQWL